jgi:hypothetical protein
MQTVATRRFLQLLLARFLLLNLLIEEAKASGGLCVKEHRRLWVYLQFRPKDFYQHTREDPFLQVARKLRYASVEELRNRIFRQYTKLSDILDDVEVPGIGSRQKPPVYCVLDDASVIHKRHIEEYRPFEKETVSHPALRAVCRAWRSVRPGTDMRVIISGIGIDMEQLMDAETIVPSSSVLRIQPFARYSYLGGFDDAESQAEYIQRYILAPWTEPSWQEFLVRAFDWFRGR